MVILSNAFSLSMLEVLPALIEVRELSIDEVKKILSGGFTSAVGHESTAEVLSQLIGTRVETNRIRVTLTKQDTIIVFQLLERLPEGAILTADEIRNLKYKFILVNLK